MLNNMDPWILALVALFFFMAVVWLACRRRLVLGPAIKCSVSKLIPQLCLPDPELGVSFIALDLRILF